MTNTAAQAPDDRPIRTPERELLQACLCVRLDEAAMHRVHRAATQSLNWNRFCSFAIRKRVAPLLYSVLRNEPAAPQAILEQLRQAHYQSALRNLLFTHETEPLLRDFAAAGLPVVLLKGAALLDSVYSPPALRPMQDVDVLIQRRDFERAVSICSQHGFRQLRIETRAGADLEYECEVILHKFGPNGVVVPLELHWHLFDSPYYQDNLPIEWFWEHTTSHRGDPHVRILTDEALLLHLCGHLHLHHRGDNPLWLHDIAEIVHLRGSRIDWDLIRRQARSFALLTSVREVIEEVCRDWQSPIPTEFLTALRSEVPTTEEIRASDRLAAPDRPPAQRLWDDLSTMTGWRRSVRFAALQVFPSARYMRERYGVPAALVPLAYPYRLMRGAYDAVRGWRKPPDRRSTQP
jgi:hypothetical protein